MGAHLVPWSLPVFFRSLLPTCCRACFSKHMSAHASEMFLQILAVCKIEQSHCGRQHRTSAMRAGAAVSKRQAKKRRTCRPHSSQHAPERRLKLADARRMWKKHVAATGAGYRRRRMIFTMLRRASKARGHGLHFACLASVRACQSWKAVGDEQHARGSPAKTAHGSHKAALRRAVQVLQKSAQAGRVPTPLPPSAGHWLCIRSPSCGGAPRC